jgi:hypothetical protein
MIIEMKFVTILTFLAYQLAWLSIENLTLNIPFFACYTYIAEQWHEQENCCIV